MTADLLNRITLLLGASEQDSGSYYTLQQPIRRQRKPSLLSASPAVILLAILLGFILGVATSMASLVLLGWRKQDADLVQQCAMRMSRYSPVWNEVDKTYSTTYFNGSFMQEMVYRRPGSPEVDEAWQALGIEYRASVITEEEGNASGLSKHHVQRAQKYGGGYFVQVEGLHHLHCLNMVRKSLYYNYDYYKATGDYAFDGDEIIVKYHVSHCLDIIRQVLMCNVDTGVLGQVWTQHGKTKYPQAFPDFNTQHFCKNYDAVRRWAEVHQIPPNGKLPDAYVAPPEEADVLPYIPK